MSATLLLLAQSQHPPLPTSPSAIMTLIVYYSIPMAIIMRMTHALINRPNWGFWTIPPPEQECPALFIEASLCLLTACCSPESRLAAGVRPDGSHLCWRPTATTAVKGAIRITGVYIERISDSMSPALSIDEKNRY